MFSMVQTIENAVCSSRRRFVMTHNYVGQSHLEKLSHVILPTFFTPLYSLAYLWSSDGKLDRRLWEGYTWWDWWDYNNRSSSHKLHCSIRARPDRSTEPPRHILKNI